ncbi:MAG: hypothetical protein CL674_03110 [Bdellovibrionaceae bacterium]|nr:hypothetical protein [Pseudobdellovibrionaceae bacterium]|tara:strand:+ start:132 stop:941 length:810 start_codon:yes stop_codon:yes gene_type:complete
MKTVFEFKDYKAYLKNCISQMPRAGRGARVAMAKAISSPVSHVSQILNATSHLSMEQAEAVNAFLDHTEDESDFFLLLVQFSRSGTQALKKRLQKQMQQAIEKRLVLKESLGVKAEISKEDQALFYSSWLYGAVHVMTSIPQFQTRQAIAEYLNVSPKRIAEVLEFLESKALVLSSKNGYEIGKNRIHLGSDSPMISKFHTNWRMKAVQAFEKEQISSNLHYSSVISISENDREKIKVLLVKYIDNIKNIIRDSKEEGVHCFSIDFFNI